MKLYSRTSIIGTMTWFIRALNYPKAGAECIGLANKFVRFIVFFLIVPMYTLLGFYV